MADRLQLTLAQTLPEFDLAVDTTLDLTGPTALFGPSGSGKSTVLRAIAGLPNHVRGLVSFNGTRWLDSDQGLQVPAHQRNVTLLLQAPGLFANTTVAGNLDLAEQFSRRRRGDRATDRDAVLQALDLGALLDRRPATLSGGEQRRVALARALLSSPDLLLLDEPLTGLDAARKRDILPYLKDALATFQRPALLVSHDIGEVAALCEQMVVMDAGRIRQRGATDALIEDLALTPYTGRFEAGVLIDGEVAGHDPHRYLTAVRLPGATSTLSMPLSESLLPGETIRLRVRARDVAVATEAPRGLSIRNVLAGTLLSLTPEPTPGFVDALIAVGDVRLRARLTRAAVQELELKEGQSIFALVKSVSFDLG